MNDFAGPEKSMGMHKGRRTLRLLCFCFIAASIWGGCTLPEAPGNLSWDVPLTVPMGVRVYSLNDLVDSSRIYLTSDSILYYSVSTNVNVSIADSIYVGPVEDTLIKPSWMTDTTSLRPLIGYRHRLLAATILEGTLWLTVENVSDTADSVRTVLPNIVDSRGDTIVIAEYMPPHSRTDTVIDLTSYVVRLPNTSPQHIETRLHSTGTAEIHAYVRTDRVTFRYYTGELDSLEIDAIDGGTAIEQPPEGWESVHPTRLEAVVHVDRGLSGAVADAELSFSTWDGHRVIETADLTVTGLSLNRDSSVTISDLANLLAVYPDSASATGSVVLSGTITNLQPNDTLRLRVEGRAHLAFTLDPVHSPGSIDSIKNGELEDIQSGAVRFRIWNRLPSGGEAFVVISRDSAALAPESGADVDTVAKVTIPQPALVNGRAQSEVYTEITVTLTDSMLSLMRTPPFCSRTDITLPGSNGDTLYAHASDYIKVQPVIEMVLRMQTEDDE